MGWLCPRCGAENPFSAGRCRACGERAGVGFRLGNQVRAFWETYEDDAERQAIILRTVAAVRNVLTAYLRIGSVLCVLFCLWAMADGNPLTALSALSDNLPVLSAQSRDGGREQWKKMERLARENRQYALLSGAAFREETNVSIDSEAVQSLSDEFRSAKGCGYAEISLFASQVADMSRHGAERSSQRWRTLRETLSGMYEERRNLEES